MTPDELRAEATGFACTARFAHSVHVDAEALEEVEMAQDIAALREAITQDDGTRVSLSELCAELGLSEAGIAEGRALNDAADDR